VPTTTDLEFVRGDKVVLSFFFPGVCWTTTAPTGALPMDMTWVMHVWNAQIRDPSGYSGDPCATLCGGSWIPMWGGLPTNAQIDAVTKATLITEFLCSSTFIGPDEVDIANPQYDTYGTLVTITLDNTVEGSGSLIYPTDTYRWDLQTGTAYNLDTDMQTILSVAEPLTVLQGSVTVLADYTYAERVISS